MVTGYYNIIILLKKKTPKSKHLDGTNSEERQLNTRAKFISDIHNVICNKFISELNKRKIW